MRLKKGAEGFKQISRKRRIFLSEQSSASNYRLCRRLYPGHLRHLSHIDQTELCGGLPNTYSMITQDTSSRHQTGLTSLFKKEKSPMKSSALLCSTLYCITAGLRSCSAHVCLCYELHLITADTLKHYSLQSLNIYPGKMDRWT